MQILIGSDHGGYKLKELLKEYIKSLGYEVIDYGTYSEETTDYPLIGEKLAKDVVNKRVLGILICGTGLGMCIVANKIKGVRATLCYDEYTAKMAKSHNNANILCLGGRTLSYDKAKLITKVWLETPFSNEERHIRRLSLIEDMEKRC